MAQRRESAPLMLKDTTAISAHLLDRLQASQLYGVHCLHHHGCHRLTAKKKRLLLNTMILRGSRQEDNSQLILLPTKIGNLSERQSAPTHNMNRWIKLQEMPHPANTCSPCKLSCAVTSWGLPPTTWLPATVRQQRTKEKLTTHCTSEQPKYVCEHHSSWNKQTRATYHKR